MQHAMFTTLSLYFPTIIKHQQPTDTTYLTVYLIKQIQLENVFSEVRLNSRALHVGKMTSNQRAFGSGKIETISSCTKLVCCLARLLNARLLRQQI